jgi:DNA-binding transcriptional LysR family regulator
VKHFTHYVREHSTCSVDSLTHFWCGVSGASKDRVQSSDFVCLQSSSDSSGCLLDGSTSRVRATDLHAVRHLHVAVPASIAHTLIAPALPRFIEQHPSMRVHLVIVDGISQLGRFDAAIWMQSTDSHAPLNARRLAVIPHVLCASEEFLAVHGTPRGPHELNPAHCIGVLDENLSPQRWSFQQGSTEVKIVPAAPLMFSDAQSAAMSAVRGGGMILVPTLAVEAQIAAGLLMPLLSEWTAPRSAVWIQHASPLTTELETFMQFVADLFPSRSE